jgi:hypothetical protein
MGQELTAHRPQPTLVHVPAYDSRPLGQLGGGEEGEDGIPAHRKASAGGAGWSQLVKFLGSQ